MSGKPISTIVEELNNLLTVVAMCTDEIEALGPQPAPLADLRTAVRRGAVLTRMLADLHPSAAPTPDADPISSGEVQVASATVLVVDGDHATRRSLSKTMIARGWHIVEAGTIEEATARVASASAIDVVVIDTNLASRRFASRIVDRFPGASVVYMGGYIDDRPLREELPKTEVALVCRPFDDAALVARVDEAIVRGSAASR